MAMDFLRGLFGSSGRQYVNARPNDTRLRADPNSYAGRQDGNGAVLKRMPTLTPDLQTPKEDRAKKWQVIGATMQDVGNSLRGGQGGSLDRVQAGWRAREKEEKALAEMEQLRSLATELYGDDEEARLLFEASPEAFTGAMIKERTPQYVEGPGGIYEVRGGESRLVQKYEPEPEKLNFGWSRDPESNRLVPQPGGPADPDYIAKTAGVRREAVTTRPMPRVGGEGGGRGGGGSSGGMPWKQRWGQ